MKCKWLWGVCMLVGLPVLSCAATLEEVMALIEKADEATNTFQFEFKQEISYLLTNETQANTGEVSFSKPHSLYLKQNKPVEQVIIANGKKVWIYTPGYKQVVEDTWKKWMNNSMVPASLINFGKGWGELKKKYTF